MNVHDFPSEHHPPVPPPPMPLLNPQPISAQKGGEKPFTEILLSTNSAAATRNEEATLFFQNIACILDDATNEEHLPQHLIKIFREFVANLTAVARRYFYRHVRGSSRPPAPYSLTVKQPSSTPVERHLPITNSGVALPKHIVTHTMAAVAAKISTPRQQQQQQHQQQKRPPASK